MKSKLFGSSGVRGVANVELTPALAARIGVAIAKHSRARRILVARDTRISGLMLENALVSGFLASGAKVNVLGVLPTPVLAFLTKKLKADVGVMITASHNPREYNGIKVFNRNSQAYDEESQNEIERIITHEPLDLADWRQIGDAAFIDESDHYIEMIVKTVRLQKNWHVVVDPGCGAACNVAPVVLKKVGCKLTVLNSQPDGFFPARSPEPSPESLENLMKTVKKLNADVGVAYDGDGDRVSFVSQSGEFADFDSTLAAYAASVVKKERGRIVVTNVEASMSVDSMVKRAGGEVVRTKVGDVYIAEEIVKNNAALGGEPCGAWIHPQVHLCPDGILSSVLLLKALEEECQTLAEFIAEVPRYYTLRKNIFCRNSVKNEIVEKVGKSLKTAFPNYREFLDIDGVRLSFPDGWILVRASGTEPLIRITVEGESRRISTETILAGITLVKKHIQESSE